jgi:hypothetical protein
MRAGRIITALALVGLAAAPASADVRLTINNGRVSISARDATVRQILAEWARVGQTKILNVERITGAPLTLELQNVPESQALEILLRTVSGYMAAPRPEAIANASQFDRIVVMPTSSPARPAGPAASAATPAFRSPPQPQFGPAAQQPQFVPPTFPPIDDDDRDNDEPPAPAVPPNAGPRGPLFPVQPSGQQIQQQPTAPSGYAPMGIAPAGAPPVGVAVPGMVVPAPQQPNQPGVPPQQPGTRTPDGRIID